MKTGIEVSISATARPVDEHRRIEAARLAHEVPVERIRPGGGGAAGTRVGRMRPSK